MLSLATVFTTLLRFRARACVVLACVAAMLCATSIASAHPSVQPKTRVWDFSFAEPLNTWLERAASPRTHLENRIASPELASVSPHAARGAAGAGRTLAQAIPQAQKQLIRQLFRTGGEGGVTGANNALRAIRAGDLSVVPEGLTRQTLLQYQQIAQAAPATQAGVQAIRLEIIGELLKVIP